MKDFSEQNRRTRRIRDFFVLGLVGVSLLGLLFFSGALGILEFLTASLVLILVYLAYYIGSASFQAVASGRSDFRAEASKRDNHQIDYDGKESLEAVLLALPFAALLISPEQRIVTMNRMARILLDQTDPVGQLDRLVLRQPDLLAATKRVAQSSDREEMELSLNGSTENWMAHIEPGPEPGSVLVLFEDRTAVRRAERARADFLANASHELRTPLTALAGFIETMRGPAKDDKAAWDHFLEIMQQQTERMKRLVSDLLSLSRIEFSEHRAPDTLIDLNATVQRARQSLDPIAHEKNIELQVQLPDTSVWAIADEDECVQLIQNLVSNAIKYSAKGGVVQLCLGQSDSMQQAEMDSRLPFTDTRQVQLLHVRASATLPAAWLVVRDRGAGIAEEHLPRLGERFYRVDESRGGRIEGTGLGLAIVKHIIARHQGGLAVESKENEGTVFSVWLPRLDDVE